MTTPRRGRRRLVLVVVVASTIAVIAAYRDRTLRRHCSEFVAQYGD
jgi:hypothetical protein